MEQTLKDLHQSILHLAEKNHFLIENIYKSSPVDIIALTKQSSVLGAPTIYLSSGIHGDEPAGPYTISKLLENSFFDDSINWYIIPILNPRGLSLGTRENPQGIDLNRDYKAAKSEEIAAHLEWLTKHQNILFDLTITLHEDWESPGFYAYATVPSKYSDIISKIAQAVEKVSPINLARIIEGSEAQGGFIINTVDDLKDLFNSWVDWPEAFWLMQNQKIPFHFTFETATCQPLDQRIQTHTAAIRAAITILKEY